MSTTPKNLNKTASGSQSTRRRLHESFTIDNSSDIVTTTRRIPSGSSLTKGSRNVSGSTTNIAATNSRKPKKVSDFDFDPLSSPKPSSLSQNSSKSSQYPSLESSRRQSSNSIESSTDIIDATGTSSSHAQDLLQNQTIKETTPEEQAEKLKEAAQLATVFLEMREAIMTNHNVDTKQNERTGFERNTVPSLEDSDLPFHKPLGYNPHQPHKKVSKATVQRAERVKAMMNLYYFAMFQCQKLTDPSHNSVAGIYNPLQIIRNRKVKKRYQVHQENLSLRVLPYASTAFSQRKDSKKFPWEIELHEVSREYIWRAQHMNELLDPRGELWYPPNDEKNLRHKHRHRFSGHHRHRSGEDHGKRSEAEEENETVNNIHDKLFDVQSDDGNEDGSDPITNTEEDRNTNNAPAELSLPEIATRNLTSRSRSASREEISAGRPSRTLDKINDKIRKRSKSPFKKSSNTANNTNTSQPGLITPLRPLSGDLSISSLEDRELPANVTNDSFVNPQERHAQHNNFFEGITIEPVKPHHQSPNPTSKGSSDDTGTDYTTTSVAGGGISGSNGTFTTHKDSSASQLKELSIRSEQEIIRAKYDQDMRKYYNKLINLSDLLDVSDNFFQIKSLQYQSKISQLEVLENQMNKDPDFVEKNPLGSNRNHHHRRPSIASSFSTEAQQHGSLTLQKLDEYESLITTINRNLENYKSNSIIGISNDLDRHLLNSDRNIGEINTTLSLELRKLNEKFEKISYSFKSYNFKIQPHILKKHRKSKSSTKSSAKDDDQEEDEALDASYHGSRLTDGAFENTVYWVLEHLVVVLLWLIWFLFWCFKVGKLTSLLVWECLKWMLSW